MAQLKIIGVVATRETEEVLVAAARDLLPEAWQVEITGNAVSPFVVRVRVRDGVGRDIGNGLFQPNHLEDIPPFLQRAAMAARGRD